jgi:hypothetical protein
MKHGSCPNPERSDDKSERSWRRFICVKDLVNIFDDNIVKGKHVRNILWKVKRFDGTIVRRVLEMTFVKNRVAELTFIANY